MISRTMSSPSHATTMLQPPRPQGLSEGEARRRLVEHGPNAIEDRERHSFADTLREVMREPMFLLLLVASAIYLLVGDLGEGLLLVGFALLSVGLVIFQQRRGERALDALRELAEPQTRVLRGRPVLAPNSLPTLRSRSPISSLSSVGNGPLPTRVA